LFIQTRLANGLMALTIVGTGLWFSPNFYGDYCKNCYGNGTKSLLAV